MEFELDLKNNQSGFWMATFTIVIGLFFLLGAIGHPLTPYAGNTARVMGWTDWQLHKAEAQYDEELIVLRKDASYLAEALDGHNNAVQVSLLVKQIEKDVADGVPALGAARLALYQSALNVGDWAIGVLPREDAIASLELAITLLEETE